jgi:aryl-alcohol dehydrogenase-like predicted oxidoreductase
MEKSEFIFKDLTTVNKRVHRLGLAFTAGISPEGIEFALSKGINYLFWTKLCKDAQREVIKAALKKDRERYVLGGGASFGYFASSLRRATEQLLRSFDVDYLDVFQLYWLGKMSAFTLSVQKELVRLREEGLVRAVGVSIHDRIRAAKLAVDSPLDLLMLRYNAAHPGAEIDIFPSYQTRRPITIAYTATSWQQLLKRPKGWTEPVMSPGDCYRFCLSNPHVDVVLSAAANREQVEENLNALDKGPLSEEEGDWMRHFGAIVKEQSLIRYRLTHFS